MQQNTQISPGFWFALPLFNYYTRLKPSTSYRHIVEQIQFKYLLSWSIEFVVWDYGRTLLQHNLIKTFQIKFAAFFVVVNMRVFNNIKICVYQRNNPADQHLGWVYDATAQEVLN